MVVRSLIALILYLSFSSSNAVVLPTYAGCTTPSGQQILTLIGVTNDIASAYKDDVHGPVILLDWRYVRTLPTEVLKFIYLHECGHHQLGHVEEHSNGRKLPPGAEYDADCYAKREYVTEYGEEAFNNLLIELETINTKQRNKLIQQCE